MVKASATRFLAVRKIRMILLQSLLLPRSSVIDGLLNGGITLLAFHRRALSHRPYLRKLIPGHTQIFRP